MTYEEYLALKASGKLPETIQFSGEPGTLILADKHDPEEDEENRIRRFSGRAYNGGMMVVGFFGPIVIDLQGLRVTEKQRPMLKDHDPRIPVGHTEGVTGGNGVTVGLNFIDVEGVMSGANPSTEEIIKSSDKGLEWQMSIGVDPTKLIFVEEDMTVEANGQEFEGPLLMIREGDLKEISFLPLGADDDTTSKVAAQAAQFKKESEMDFSKWLKACGHVESELSDADKKLLKATWKKSVEVIEAARVEAAKIKPVTVPADEVPPIQAASVPAVDEAALEKKIVAKVLAATIEANAIATACEGHNDLLIKAQEKGWDSERVQVERKLIDVQANRQNNFGSFNIGAGADNSVQSKDIEISILRAGGYPEAKIVEEYGEQAIEASHKKFQSRLGLQESMMIVARSNGYSGNAISFKGDKSNIFAAACPSIQAATSFSTISLAGIFSNVANKFLIAGFMNIEQVWREISKITPVDDFKEISSFRLNGDLQYEKVGPGGQLSHGDFSEEKFTNKADTFGKLVGITRTDLINDDLGALTQVSTMLGRGGGLAINELFWTIFLNNAAFFTAGKGNLSTGLALGITELSNMEDKFRLRKDPDGKPMGGIRPAILLTGVQPHVTARKLFKDTDIQSGSTTAGGVLNSNPHTGLYRPVSSVYISDTTIGGNATQSYLLADPLVLASIETVFLNGKEEPTVESFDADVSTLGINLRGFHDFGFNLQDDRAGVRSDGV